MTNIDHLYYRSFNKLKKFGETLMKLPNHFSSYCCFAVIMTLILSPFPIFATGLNTDLVIENPVDDYFMAGESFTAILTLTDNDGNPLYADQAGENGLNKLFLYVSGPSSNYRNVSPYPYMIVDPEGFYEETGFDPETGEIEITLPGELNGGGTYTVLFQVERIVGDHLWSAFPSGGFQVGQVRPTYTNSVRYLSCNNCHESIANHGATELGQCVACHTDDSPYPFVNLIHNEGHHQFPNCSNCHLAAADINNFSAQACFTCHNIPGGHGGYDDSDCALCHSTGGNSVYSSHNQPTPNRPGTFDLLEPVDNFTTMETPVSLSWEETTDNDDDDLLWYEVELSLEEDFDDPWVFETGEMTVYDLNDLVLDTDYWWRVRASDLNSQGRYSASFRNFMVVSNQVSGQNRWSLPDRMEILSAYPAPFNSSLFITIAVPVDSELRLKVYSLLGKEICTLTNAGFQRGIYNFSFNAEDLASGIYFVQADVPGKWTDSRKVVLMK